MRTIENLYDRSDWTFYVDESFSTQGAEIGIMLKAPNSVVIEQSFRLAFKTSNNSDEYEALIAGLWLAIEIGVTELNGFYNS